MTEGTIPSPAPGPRKRRSLLRHKSFWALAVVAVYIGLGFLALPPLIKSTATDLVADRMERELRIGAVRTNPITLEIEIEDFVLADQDGERLVGFGHLGIDFAPLDSLFNWAWTLRSVELEHAVVHEQRFADGATRLGRLLADLAAPGAEPGAEPANEVDTVAETDASAKLPRLVIQTLRLRNSGIRLDDRVPAEPVNLAIFPISLTLHDFDTRPGRDGQQRVELRIVDGGSLNWMGDFQVDPLRASGRITLEGLIADPLLPYIRQTVPLSEFGLTLGTRFDYEFALSDSGPELILDDIQVDITDIAAAAFEPPQEFLAIDALRLRGGHYNLAEQAITIDELHVAGPSGHAWLRPTGELALLDLLPDHAAGAAEGDANSDAGLSLDLAALRVDDLALRFTDHSITPAGEVSMDNVAIALDDWSLAAGSSSPLRATGNLAGGRFTLDGELGLLPAVELAADIDLSDLALATGEPWVQPHALIGIAGGRLDVAGHLAHNPRETLAWRGGLSVADLDIRESATDETVLGWQRLGVERIDLALDDGRLDMAPVELDTAFAHFEIAEDGSTSIGRLIPERESEASPANGRQTMARTEAPLRIDIAGVRIADTTLRFADHSLPLPFAARVEALGGRISRLATDQDEPADIDLQGEVGEYGSARIGGHVSPWQPTRSTDLELAFRNIIMSEYSPYSVRFAGRHIADGRLDLDLGYRIVDNALRGRNQIVLRDFRFGERQPHPDAISLPLGLAVALLKDSDGVIDIDLEVSGDVGDPEFAIGSVIRQALINLITRVASSPFSLLASLVGMDDEELDAIAFNPGSTDITPPDRERIDKLAAALHERPELGLDITGTYHPDSDGVALREQAALARIREHLAATGEDDSGVALHDAAAQRAMQALAGSLPGMPDADHLRALYLEPRRDHASPFNQAAWRLALTRHFLTAQPVTAATLQELGMARATVVAGRLQGAGTTAVATDDAATTEDGDAAPIATPTLDPERLHIAAAKPVDELHDARIRIDLAVTASD